MRILQRSVLSSVCVVLAAGLQAQTLLSPASQTKFTVPLYIPPRIEGTRGGLWNIYVQQREKWLGLLDPTGNQMLSTVWTYNDSYPGPTLTGRRDTTVQFRFLNRLTDSWRRPLPHLFPVDKTIHWADPLGQGHGEGGYTGPVPVVTHMHGAHTESGSDGLPNAWSTPYEAQKGPKWQDVFSFPNPQEAATLWYHDHALGVTRLNVYAGLAGFYLVRDLNEDTLVFRKQLPRGDYEVPLMLADKSFTSDGKLYFPSYKPNQNAPAPSVLPEFFGRFNTVNGRVWPYFDVEPRPYRFRILNAADSRFYNLSLSNSQAFQVIAGDAGLLNNPLSQTAMLLGPGERGDIIIDFSQNFGQTLILNNNAPTPFPGGANPDTHTGQVMAFRVLKPLDIRVAKTVLPTNLRPIYGPVQTPMPITNVRKLVLANMFDAYSRLMPMLGTTTGGAMMWEDPTTEDPTQHATEVWEIYNTTMHGHPIHLHATSFRVVSRQMFDATMNANGSLSNIQLKGTSMAAAPQERGWKDTVIAYPHEVTRILARFDIPGEFVWHCHLLSHEDHEMMRPLLVKPN